MFLKFFAFLLVLFAYTSTALSQNETPSIGKIEKQAKKAFKHEDFEIASKYYEQLVSLEASNIDYNYNLGICYFNTGLPGKSIVYFEYVKSRRTSSEFPNVEYFLGKAYHSEHNFEKALDEYQRFFNNIQAQSKSNKELLQEITKNIRNCEVGKSLMDNKIDCRVQNLFEKINTAGNEQYPLSSSDGKYLYFSTRNPEHESEHIDSKLVNDPGDIFLSTNMNGSFSSPKILDFNLHTNFLDAPVHISQDGNTLYLLTITPENAQDIYFSEKTNQIWMKPRKMGKPFNSAGNETGFTMNKEGNIAVFSSDRAGGYGGQDLYLAYKDENGKWGEAINMGPTINSAFNEETPSILADGNTIYFSCNGMNSIGGYDLFKTRLINNTWSQPENLGFPINTAANENSPTMFADGMKGYFSSNRKGGQGGEDIYSLQIYDNSLSPAKYLSYYANNQFFEEVLKKPVPDKTLNEVIYFDFNAASIAEYSEKTLDRIVLMLNTYPSVKLEIQGYTDNKGTDEANHLVSERRAKAVYRYLLSKGISSNRIKPVGYSTESPVSTGESELEQALNRRVVFKALAEDLVISNNKYLGEYFVVKGTFANQTNAMRMKNQLAAQKLKCSVIEPDATNKFYRVILGGASNYEEAYRILESLPNEHKEGAWILLY
jgi:outer membrane protein OmpA-like peptidoglycan-associated protein